MRRDVAIVQWPVRWPLLRVQRAEKDGKKKEYEERKNNNEEDKVVRSRGETKM